MDKITKSLMIALVLCALCPKPVFAGVYTIPSFYQAPDTGINRFIQLSGKRSLKSVLLQWSAWDPSELKQANVQFSGDGNAFATIHHLSANAQSFTEDWPANRVTGYYRLELLWKNDLTTLTNTVIMSGANLTSYILLQTNPVVEVVRLKICNNNSQNYVAEWRSSQGTLVQTQTFQVPAGVNTLQLTPPAEVTPGNYYLRIISDDKKQRQLFRILKQ